jgi:hypothetical protein
MSIKTAFYRSFEDILRNKIPVENLNDTYVLGRGDWDDSGWTTHICVTHCADGWIVYDAEYGQFTHGTPRGFMGDDGCFNAEPFKTLEGAIRAVSKQVTFVD